MLNCGCEGEIGKNITVVDNQAFALRDQVADIGNSPAGLQEDGFVNEIDWCIPVSALRESCVVGFRAMVGIDDEPPDTSGDQVIECIGDQRAVAERNEWLGEVFGKWPEAGPQTSAEHESGLHVASIAERRVFAKT